MGGRESRTITSGFSNGGCALGNYIRHISPVVSSQNRRGRVLSHRNADQLPAATVHGYPLSLLLLLLPLSFSSISVPPRAAGVGVAPALSLKRSYVTYFNLSVGGGGVRRNVTVRYIYKWGLGQCYVTVNYFDKEIKGKAIHQLLIK